MKIQVWADFLCPFCLIGSKQMEAALVAEGAEAEVEYMSYSLSDAIYPAEGEPYWERLAAEKGWSEDEVIAARSDVDALATEAGLSIDWRALVRGNTKDAHRLFQYAKAKGKGTEFFRRTQEAVFLEGALISDRPTLVALAKEVGLNPAEAESVLAKGEYEGFYIRDLVRAEEIGIRGVPFFLFDEKYTIAGAAPMADFQAAIRRAQTKE